jgi:triacylglycerol esterase/lipase EstA (alpha/beta hydrolase family)
MTVTVVSARWAAIAPAILGLLALGPSPVVAAASPGPLPSAYYGPLPVPLSKTAAQRAGIADKNAVPAGADYFDPRLAGRHPHPVVLVHGLYDNADSAWQSLAPLLRNAGFNVWAFNVGRYARTDAAGGLADLRDSARQLRADVALVRAATGADKVDLVGHSEGGVVISWYIDELGGDRTIGTVVDLSAPNAGITEPQVLRPAVTAILGHDAPALADLDNRSPFIGTLLARGAARPTVRYTCVGSRYDEVVFPHSSLYLPAADNVTDIELQDRYPTDAAEHFALPYDPYALAETVHALDPLIDWHIPPGVVAPYEGGYTPLP